MSQEPIKYEHVWLVEQNGGEVVRNRGVLTIDESSVHWTANDKPYANGSEMTSTEATGWSTEFSEVNLHAIGDMDSDEVGSVPNGIDGYVLVQYGEECKEVRLECSSRETVNALYDAFCAGVGRFSSPDDGLDSSMSLLGSMFGDHMVQNEDSREENSDV